MTTVVANSNTPADQLPLFDRLPAEHLFDMYVELQPAQLISTTLGTRLTFITNGGVIEGPRLQAELLPGGGDWMLVGTDQIGPTISSAKKNASDRHTAATVKS